MTKGDPVASPPSVTPTNKVGHFRWFICGLFFYATTVNYMDRVVLGLLKTTISRDLHWTDSDYGTITAVFQFGYALMLPIAGRVNRLARHPHRLHIRRIGLGPVFHRSLLCRQSISVQLGASLPWFGEAANFPAAIKTVADWFPRKERALATGVFNSGTNVGALIAPLIVPFVVARFGWHSAFLVTGSFSLSWIFVWLLVLSRARKESATVQGRTRTDSFRQRRGVERQDSLSGFAHQTFFLGFPHCKILHRSGLVVLSILDTGFPAKQISY